MLCTSHSHSAASVVSHFALVLALVSLIKIARASKMPVSHKDENKRVIRFCGYARTSVVFFALFTLNLGLNAQAQANDVFPSFPYAIHASVVNYLGTATDRKEEYWITFSSNGVRTNDPSKNLELVKNFDNSKVWMLNNKMNQMLELDLEGFSQAYPDEAKNMMLARTSDGLISEVPCVGLSKQHVGKKLWRGSLADVWSCVDEENIEISTQYLSESWGFVVRAEHISGYVEELRNMKIVEVPNDHFSVGASFEAVSFRELVMGEYQLEQYSDQIQ